MEKIDMHPIDFAREYAQYSGIREHQQPLLPTQSTDWLSTGRPGLSKKLVKSSLLQTTLANIQAHGGWQWPIKDLCFISDLHADAGALRLTLEGLGYQEPSAKAFQTQGPGTQSFQNQGPTAKAFQTRFVIGGDCLDKGPSNFALLDEISELKRAGLDLLILAGNHDLRFLVGMKAVLSNEPSAKHFFLRMMPKVLPLLKESLEMPEAQAFQLAEAPSEAQCRDLLLPGDDWELSFRNKAGAWMAQPAIEKELARTARKRADLSENLAQLGLDYQALYRAVKTCEKMFLQPDGRYFWFFDQMQLMHREASFVFVHAGLCESTAGLLVNEGADAINQHFRAILDDDLLRLYFGPMVNVMRTKYRDTDYQLTPEAVASLASAGIHAVVHGHRSRPAGQRLAMRKGLIHFEADITLDRNSRSREGLKGVGAGALQILPHGEVLGSSVDYPMIKSFKP